MKHDGQRLARIETEARVLARSGEYFTFRSIEAALLERGFLEAASFLPTNGRKQKWIAFAIEPRQTLGCRDEAMFPLRQAIGISDSLPEVLEPFKPLVGRSQLLL